MSTEDLLELICEYPLPKGWYARFPGLQEPANYGTKFKTGIYEEQVKSGYRLPLHPFALRFFEHHHMAPGQLVPNGWRKLVRLIYLVQTSGYKPNATDFMKIVKRVSIDEDPIFRPRWTFRCDDIGMPDSHISEQHLFHRVLSRDKEMYSGSEMLSRFDMVKQVAAEEAQQKRDTIKEADEATRRGEELSKYEADYLAQIETLERRLKRAKRKVAEEIYEMGFVKAIEMFAERFPDISLDDFVMPIVVSPSGGTVMPSKAGDATASHPPEEGPSGDAPEP
ncbi:hypothetical protein RJ639_015737 [Escallonia herrerae]|uniref:Transposase (putative) gypsy type domain-containing protein n=1 Tax=Escallonia herrerae TaxID=1293975 RepID=A0AA89AJ34_9ASTE|nr:hypothetical protein RJ639_015737 [Escallonia herrerae]